RELLRFLRRVAGACAFEIIHRRDRRARSRASDEQRQEQNREPHFFPPSSSARSSAWSRPFCANCCSSIARSRSENALTSITFERAACAVASASAEHTRSCATRT